MRVLSGSQTMAYVMALQQNWPTDELKFRGACVVFSLPLHSTTLVYINITRTCSQQRHPRAHRQCERRFDERVYVGVVHHETVCRCWGVPLRESSPSSPLGVLVAMSDE